MALEGRGRHYSRTRALSEWVLAHAYRGGWAPRLMHRVGLGPRVRVVREHIAVDGERWPRGQRALRIGFLSDLHAGPTTHPDLWRDAIARVRENEPDVVLLGGDYVFIDAKHVDPLARELATIRAPLGRFAVMGNHDLWADDARIQQRLEDAGYRVLINETVKLPPPFDPVSICGLDDPWTGVRDVRKGFENAGDVRVVLVHSSRALELIADERFDVMITGHSHGGHIALPGGIPIIAVTPREHAHGRHDVGAGRTLVVSRGIGGIEVPLRTFADPDVLALTLGPA